MSGNDSQDKIIELSELAGGLAHEIRNPLSTFKVNLQLLAEDLHEAQADSHIDPDLQRRTLQRIGTLRAESDRLQHLLEDFLRLVSRHDIVTERVDLNDVVQHLVDFLHPRAKQQSIQLSAALADGALICAVDRSLIQQALLNLCLNAQQAMPQGGELTIATTADDDQVQVDICDTGVGIEPDLLERVFAPFFSTKKDGSGLGLPLTRRIVNEHGGTITVQSEPGKGSRFTVRLPLARAQS